MSKHVLIAEDETLIADMMSKVLSKENVRVTIAHNGREALEVMEKEVPDVLLLDLLMPVLDGHEVMKGMKEKKIKCPIIVVSNVNERHNCKKFDIQEYFVKSDIDDDALLTTIERYLR